MQSSRPHMPLPLVPAVFFLICGTQFVELIPRYLASFGEPSSQIATDLAVRESVVLIFNRVIHFTVVSACIYKRWAKKVQDGQIVRTTMPKGRSSIRKCRASAASASGKVFATMGLIAPDLSSGTIVCQASSQASCG